MGSKGCSLIRFWRNLTEKDNGESAKYDKQFFFYMYLQFFSRIRIGTWFLADPDPYSGKKSDPEKNPDPNYWSLEWLGLTHLLDSIVSEEPLLQGLGKLFREFSPVLLTNLIQSQSSGIKQPPSQTRNKFQKDPGTTFANSDKVLWIGKKNLIITQIRNKPQKIKYCGLFFLDLSYFSWKSEKIFEKLLTK